MVVDWLYRTTVEVSLLIGLVLFVRPVVRRVLGARAAYWLWFIPLIRAVLVDRPEWPRSVVEAVGVQGSELSIEIYPSPDVWILPSGVPWDKVWIAGALLWVALRVMSAIRFGSVLASQSTSLELPAQLSSMVPERLQRHGPRYFATDVPGTPFVAGLVRPRVYLPTDFFQKFSPEQQRWVIQHELTHTARKDLWMQLIWEVLRSVFWFNPIIHLAAGALRDDQELACDQSVLSHSSNQDRYCYGKTLLIGAGPHLFPSLLSFFGKQKERIAMIRNHRSSLRRDLVGLGLCALVGLFVLTKAPVSVAQAVSGEPISVNFKDMDVADLVGLIVRGFGPSEVTGIEQLRNKKATLQVKGVPAREALQHILNCVGFTYVESKDSLAIVPLKTPDASSACGSVHMEIAKD